MNNDQKQIDEAFERVQNEDYAGAVLLLEPIAERGVPRAQYYLATLYHLGLGVKPDGQLASNWYRQAADQQNDLSTAAAASNNLWCLYVTGMPGIEPDADLAKTYFQRAQELGFPMSRPPNY
jgi:TPR repeat protein